MQEAVRTALQRDADLQWLEADTRMLSHVCRMKHCQFQWHSSTHSKHSVTLTKMWNWTWAVCLGTGPGFTVISRVYKPLDKEQDSYLLWKERRDQTKSSESKKSKLFFFSKLLSKNAKLLLTTTLTSIGPIIENKILLLTQILHVKYT